MLRALTSADLPQLLLIELATQWSPWSASTFEHCFAAGSYGWVLESSGLILGFILVLNQHEEAHILNLNVRPEYQRQGLGRQLLAYALKNAKAGGVHLAYLEVRLSNHSAISLYKKMGFMQIGERQNYYAAGDGRENALVFAKDLTTE